MDKKTWLPITVLTVVLVLSLLMVYNNQLVYGGDKGLVLASIHKLVTKDIIQLSGNVVLNQDSNNDYSALDFILNGDINLKDNESLIECYIQTGGYLMDTPIATYLKDADTHKLELNWGETTSEIPLDDYVLDSLSDALTDERIDSLYETAKVYKALIPDPRSGYRHLTIHTTCYEYQTSFGDALPADLLQDVLVKLYVDGGANLLLVELSANSSGGVVEANILFK